MEGSPTGDPSDRRREVDRPSRLLDLVGRPPDVDGIEALILKEKIHQNASPPGTQYSPMLCKTHLEVKAVRLAQLVPGGRKTAPLKKERGREEEARKPTG